MMAHDPACTCTMCVHVRAEALAVEQSDCDALADAWAKWVSASDGEAAALRQGNHGSPGSPRWTALQAIAQARLQALATAAIERTFG